MKLKFLYSLFLFAIVMNTNVSGQAPGWIWAVTAGNVGEDEARSIALDANGNVYTTGFFNDTVDFDPGPGTYFLTAPNAPSLFIMKLDSIGNFVWARAVSGSSSVVGNAIGINSSNGNVYVTGVFEGAVDFDPGAGVYLSNSNGSSDFFILQLDNNGNFIMVTPIGGSDEDIALSASVDPSGNGDIMVTGRFQGTVDFDPGAGNSSLTGGANTIFIARYSGTGNLMWTTLLEGTGFGSGNAITIADNGNAYLTGYFNGTLDFDPGAGNFDLTSVAGHDVFVLELSGAGNFVLARVFEGTNNEEGQNIQVDNSGNIYVAGYFRETMDFDPGVGVLNMNSVGDWDNYVFKLDSNGDLDWARTFGGTSNDGTVSLKVDADGNTYLAGFYSGSVDFDPDINSDFIVTSNGFTDIFVSKLSSNGNFVWVKSVGGIGLEYCFDIAINSQQQVFLAGLFGSPIISFDAMQFNNSDVSGSTNDFLVAKLDKINTALPDLSASLNFVVYPNPASNEILIRINEEMINTPVNIILASIEGKIIRKISLENASVFKVDIHDLAGGVYHLNIGSDNELFQMQQLIIIR